MPPKYIELGNEDPLSNLKIIENIPLSGLTLIGLTDNPVTSLIGIQGNLFVSMDPSAPFGL